MAPILHLFAKNKALFRLPASQMGLPGFSHQRRRRPSDQQLNQAFDGTVEYLCEGQRNPDPERKYPGGKVDSINTDPEEVGAVAKHIQKKDTGLGGVLKPERDERRKEWFSPGGEDTATADSGTDGPERNPRKRRCGGEALSNPGAETAEDVLEERRSAQTGHVLGRTWPSQPKFEENVYVVKLVPGNQTENTSSIGT
ncbi:hypothetical protein NDU88_001388 [Pleurodeles waltl]|uniref:Uncharacterized protein n=1 Tax=Pleurodeles waltl TaxID=8319 RepID=A0AAV7MKV6_PLEWA|nr:hypothetical protein NDU88_001388 [Pleurodeles waltl]